MWATKWLIFGAALAIFQWCFFNSTLFCPLLHAGPWDTFLYLSRAGVKKTVQFQCSQVGTLQWGWFKVFRWASTIMCLNATLSCNNILTVDSDTRAFGGLLCTSERISWMQKVKATTCNLWPASRLAESFYEESVYQNQKVFWTLLEPWHFCLLVDYGLCLSCDVPTC